MAPSLRSYGAPSLLIHARAWRRTLAGAVPPYDVRLFTDRSTPSTLNVRSVLRCEAWLDG